MELFIVNSSLMSATKFVLNARLTNHQ